MNNVQVETGRRIEVAPVPTQCLPEAAESRGYSVSPISSLRLIVPALALVLVAATGREALAADPPPAQLTVTALVEASCTLNGGTLAFGVYTGEENDATGQFTYQCTDGTNITLSLDPGENAQGTTRMMANGGELLAYELYKDSNRSQVWGVGANGLDVNGTSAELEPAQVFGRILAGEDAAPGSYSDTVQITLVIN